VLDFAENLRERDVVLRLQLEVNKSEHRIHKIELNLETNMTDFCSQTMFPLKQQGLNSFQTCQLQDPPLLFRQVTRFNWSEAIQRCLSHPVEAGYQDPASGITALHAACRTTSTPVSVIFALLHAYPQAASMHTTHYASTPLHFACWRNLSLDIVKMLLLVFPNATSQVNGLGLTPLHLAARTRNVAVVKLLLETNPDVVCLSRVAGYTPLHLAVRGAAVALQFSIASLDGKEISIQNEQNDGSLYAAFEVVRLLLKKSPQAAFERDRNGESPLRLFCRSMDQAIQTLLHLARKTADESEFLKTSPIVDACWRTFVSLLRASNPNSRNKTTMHVVAGSMDCLESFAFTLLSLKICGDELSVFDVDGNLPIHIMSKLLQNPPQYKSSRSEDKTHAEDQPSLNAMDLFLVFYRNAASISNRSGILPLHILVSGQNPIWQEGVKSLLRANPAAVTKRDGKTNLFPFMMAAASDLQQTLNEADSLVSLTTTFCLLRACPEFSRFSNTDKEVSARPSKRRKISS